MASEARVGRGGWRVRPQHLEIDDAAGVHAQLTAQPPERQLPVRQLLGEPVKQGRRHLGFVDTILVVEAHLKRRGRMRAVMGEGGRGEGAKD